jgi:hypothetical protein
VVVAWADLTAGQYEVSIRPPGGAFSAPIQAGPLGSGLPQSTPVAIDDAGDVLVGVLTYNGLHYVASYAWRSAGGTFAVSALSEPTTDAGEPVVAMDRARAHLRRSWHL